MSDCVARSCSLKRSSYPGSACSPTATSSAGTSCDRDLNLAFKEIVGEEFTSSDPRDWAATVTAAVSLAQTGPSETEREQKRAEKDAMKVKSTPRQHPAAGAALRRPPAARRVRRRAHDRAEPEEDDEGDRERLQNGDLVRVRDRDALERAVMRLVKGAS